MLTWSELGIDIPASAKGPEVYTTCPKCSAQRHKHPKAKCLSANIVEGVFVCHHCGWAGNLTGRKVWHPAAWQKPEWVKPAPRVQSPVPPQLIAWFARRGITADVVAHYGIGWERVYIPQIEDHAPAIVFPYVRGGELVNHKYRTLDKHFRMDTGCERVLYGLDDIDPACVVIVEGEIDKLSCAVAGITSAVSVPDGAPAVGAKNYSAKFGFLDSASDALAPIKKFILAVDNDPPGRVLEDELARRLGRERCWRVQWPGGAKDANDVLVQYGADTLRECIANAQPFPIDGVFTTTGGKGKVAALYRTGLERGRSTGWGVLDKHFTVRPGEFTVVIGIPGSGKSSFIDALVMNLVHLHGWPVALCSPENQPLEDHMARMAEKHVGKPFSPGPTPRMTEQELDAALDWMGSRFFWMIPGDETACTMEWILARAKELVFRNGIRVLVVDPWNELEPQRLASESETEYVARTLSAVRQFARRHGVHVFIVVHPAKLYREKGEKEYPVPTLYDASGSAHFRNKSDNGISLWRNFKLDTGELEVHVQKIRFRQIGKIGTVTLHYEPVTAMYRETSAPMEFGVRGEQDDDEAWAND